MSLTISGSAKYYDGKTGNPKVVSLILTGSSLRLTHNNNVLETWSVNSIDVIDHPSPPVPGIYGHNKNKDARLYIDSEKEWKRIYERLPRSSKRRIRLPTHWSSFFLYAFMSLFSLYFLFLMVPRIVENAAYLIPIDAERSIGKSVVGSMTSGKKLCVAPGGTRALNKIFNTMTAQTSRDIEYNVYVVKNGYMPNAFAAPGGYLVVYSEVIDQAETPEEVFGVLAHEIAHVDLYHTTKGIARDLGVRFFLALMFGGTSFEDAAALISQLSYSRNDESEADLHGRSIMIKTGVNPKGMRKFFENMQKWEGGLYDTLSKKLDKGDRAKEKSNSSRFKVLEHPFWEYFSTHPNTQKRIDALKDLEGGKYYKPALSQTEWQSLKDICSQTSKFKL